MFKIFQKNSFLILIFSIFLSTAVHAQEEVNDSNFNLEREIRVQVVAQNEARLLSSMSGLIKSVSKKDGEIVKKGQVVIRYDCQILQAQLDQALAGVNKQKKMLEAAKRLKELGSGTQTKVNILNAELQEAQATARLSSAQKKDCVVTAPFSGRIASMMVKPYYSVEQGQALFNIISNSKLETEMIVPSKWMSKLKKGDVFDVMIDETGQTHQVKLERYGGKVDPVSQSVKAYGVFTGDVSGLLSGMSGRADFEKEKSIEEVSTKDDENKTEKDLLESEPLMDKDLSVE